MRCGPGRVGRGVRDRCRHGSARSGGQDHRRGRARAARHGGPGRPGRLRGPAAARQRGAARRRHRLRRRHGGGGHGRCGGPAPRLVAGGHGVAHDLRRYAPGVVGGAGGPGRLPRPGSEAPRVRSAGVVGHGGHRRERLRLRLAAQAGRRGGRPVRRLGGGNGARLLHLVGRPAGRGSWRLR